MSFLAAPLFVRRGFALSALILSFGVGSACAPSSGGDDGGTPDAAEDLSDTGDAGETDAGDRSDAGDTGDAGDGGVTCEGLDPVLGSLTLAPGFSVVESVPLQPGIGGLRAVEEGGDQRLFGIDRAQDAVVDLGLWPELSATPSKRFEVLPPDLDDEGAVVGSYVAFDGTRLAAGYTGSFDQTTLVAPGAVAFYDVTPGVADPLRYVESPNNYSADFIGETLVLNAGGLGELSEGTAIYALAGEPRVLARFEDPSSTYGGPLVALPDGSLVVAGYVSETGLQHFYLLPAAELSAALVGDAISLPEADEVLRAPVLAAARFGSDLAYLHGDFFNPVEAVRRVSLGEGAERTPVDVLTFQDDCTEVGRLTALADDLLVGVRDDEGGLRLVRIREDG